jgi:hypothetical protein
VLQHVRETGAEPFAFVNAPGHGPGLDGNNGRTVVFAHNDGEAVVECGEGDARRDGSDVAVGFCFAHLGKVEWTKVFGNGRGANGFVSHLDQGERGGRNSERGKEARQLPTSNIQQPTSNWETD